MKRRMQAVIQSDLPAVTSIYDTEGSITLLGYTKKSFEPAPKLENLIMKFQHQQKVD